MLPVNGSHGPCPVCECHVPGPVTVPPFAYKIAQWCVQGSYSDLRTYLKHKKLGEAGFRKFTSIGSVLDLSVLL